MKKKRKKNCFSKNSLIYKYLCLLFVIGEASLIVLDRHFSLKYSRAL